MFTRAVAGSTTRIDVARTQARAAVSVTRVEITARAFVCRFTGRAATGQAAADTAVKTAIRPQIAAVFPFAPVLCLGLRLRCVLRQNAGIGGLTVGKARADFGPAAPQSLILDCMFDVAGTSRSAMHHRIGASVAFAWGQVGLVEPDGPEGCTVEHASGSTNPLWQVFDASVTKRGRVSSCRRDASSRGLPQCG